MSTSDESQKYEQKSSEHSKRLADGVQAYSAELARNDLAPTAKVILPPDHKLNVTLVKLEDLIRFDELKNDEAVVFAFLTTFIGAFFGIVTNVITSGQPANSGTWVAGTMTIIFMTILFYLHRRAAQKVKLAKGKLFAGEA